VIFISVDAKPWSDASSNKRRALLRCSVELSPHFKALELLGECLLESHNVSSEAIVFLAAAAGLGNRSFRSSFLLARALSSRGKIREAIEKLDAAIELNPQYRAAVELRDELKKCEGIQEDTKTGGVR
jgi:tetratricopeptide (TPR) repeat protein